MKIFIITIKEAIVILLFSLSFIFSQSKERGDPNFRRETYIDINKVRAGITNFA